MEEFLPYFQVISAIASILLTLGGSYLFFWFRKYFPERKEAITPDQLRESLEKLNTNLCSKIEATDFTAREAYNGSISRVQSAFETQLKFIQETMTELKNSMVDAHRKSTEAMNEAKEANHKTELVEKDVTRLEQVLMEKIDHLSTLVKEGRRNNGQ